MLNRAKRLLAVRVLAFALSMSAVTPAIAIDTTIGTHFEDSANYIAPGATARYRAHVYNQGPADVDGFVVRTTSTPQMACTWRCTSTQYDGCPTKRAGHLNDTLNLRVGYAINYYISCTAPVDATGPTVDTELSITLPNGFVNTNPEQNSRIDRNAIPPPADLRLTLVDAVGAATPGLMYNFSFIAANEGPTPVASAQIVAALPQICSWSCASNSPGIPASCPLFGLTTGSSITNQIDLNPGASVRYNVVCTLPQGTDSMLVANVGVGGHTNDPDLNNNGSQTLIAVATPTSTDLVVTIDDGDNQGRVMLDEPVTYEVRAYNAGPAASDAKVQLTGQAYLGGPQTLTCEPLDGATCGTSTTQEQNINLPVGATAVIRYSATYKGRVDSGNLRERIAQGALLVNIGTTDTDTANNRAIANTAAPMFYDGFD